MDEIYCGFFKETEKLFKGSKSVRYWPYIGKGYFECPVKILVLGESHYLRNQNEREKMEQYPWWTNEVVVSDYLGQGYTQSFSSFADFPKWIKQPKNSHLKGFRNTAKMLAHSGNQCSDYVWENLAFFNFFQKPVASCPGNHEWLEADYDNYIKQARAALDEVLIKLTPNIVIIWGKDKLAKKWLPANKEQIYPNIIFFPITHPSYYIRRKCIEEWNNLVKYENISEQYALHHPYSQKIEELFFELKKIKCVTAFKTWFGERSIGFELLQEWDDLNKCFVRNSLSTKKCTAIVLLFSFENNGESHIVISTRQENELETKKIINNPLFDCFQKKRSLNCDGIFELCRMSPQTDDEERLLNIAKALQMTVSYRNSLAQT